MNLLHAILQRIRYRNHSIGERTYVRRDSLLSKRISLGCDCIIAGSELLDDCVLKDRVETRKHARIGSSCIEASSLVEAGTSIFGSKIGHHVAIQEQCLITDTEIGHHSYVARESILNLVQVGAFTSIGPRCMIGMGEHPSDKVSTSPVFYSTRGQCTESFVTAGHFDERRKITIGSDVWIGANVFIRDGVNIGDGAIIAAGSSVTKAVEPYTISGGVPAKTIRVRFSPETVSDLLQLQWWNWDLTKLRESAPLFNLDDARPLVQWAKDQGLY